MKRQFILSVCILLLLLSYPHPTHAHNGAIAIAVPVEGIVVDGDLSDWPEGMTRYPIELCEYGDKPVNEGDFKASFRIGYNSEENSLYIAVEVQDESTVIDTILQQAHWTKWWEIQDGCEVYIDLEHREIDSPSVQDVMYGNFPHVHGESEVRRVDSQHGYEWRIDIAEIMALQKMRYVKISEDRKSLRAGMTLGFDVSVSDKDRDGSFSWMVWGKGSNKKNITSARGNIILSEKDEFSIYTDYFLHNEIRCIAEDRLGTLWVGTYKGVIRYDGSQFSDFLSQEGLLDVPINSILEDRDGNLWFGTLGEGVSRYDGERLVTFPIRDNLGQNAVNSILQDRAGRLWFGTLGGGASCYDGQTFTNFTADDGLVDEMVWDMVQGQNGNIWFGTGGGVSCYDGQTFTNFTTDDGLIHNFVRSVIEDQDGNLWFGTRGGVSRYDGRTFVNFTMEDELAANYVVDILEDAKGQLWFGFNEARVNVYDGLVFQTLSKQHGIMADRILSLFQDSRSDIWIGTNNGLIRYRPYLATPSIFLTHVIADRRYGPVHQIAFPSSQKYLSFEFQGNSTKTSSDQIIYVYRLTGANTEWQKTHAHRVEYTDLPIGEYTFEVKAVDRDLSYSEEPATVKVIVHPPYSQIALWSGLGISLIGLIFASGYGIKRQRERNRAREESARAQQERLELQEKLNQELEEELQTAHDMQMGLMPTQSPTIEGLDISGRCLPANHVGGDFFQYFPISDNRLAISLADVTGHAMEAAVPVMMFSGILDTQMETGDSLEELFSKLNRSLHRNLGKRTFVCFAMGELDTASKIFRLSNGGCPYPYHYKGANGEVNELQVDAYPLGVRTETDYPVIEVQLETGDRIVFCSDGIIEAENSEEEMFGFERTTETIRSGCNSDLSAPQLLDYLISEVKAFTGDAPQGDDQTVVVLQVEA